MALTITNLYEGQVIAHTSGLADIVVSGNVGGGTHTIEARASQGSLTWTTLQVGATGTFSGTLPNVPIGRHVITVRLADVPDTRSHVFYVGVGLIFVIAGQSNSVGQGDNLQGYLPPIGPLPHASEFDGAYHHVYGLTDPLGLTPGWVDAVNDNGSTAGGSVWLLVANGLGTHATARNYPIQYIPCGVNGTGIVSWQPGGNHQDRTTYYGACVYRALQASQNGKISAILWWQGETDVQGGMSSGTYQTNLEALGDAFFADLGAPLIVTKLQDTFGGDETNVNIGITNAIGGHHILAGPNLNAIPTDDDWHLRSNTHLSTAAALFVTAIVAALSL